MGNHISNNILRAQLLNKFILFFIFLSGFWGILHFLLSNVISGFESYSIFKIDLVSSCCIIFSGIELILLQRNQNYFAEKILILIVASLICIISLLSLFAFFNGFNFIYSDPQQIEKAFRFTMFLSLPPLEAFNFLLAGISFFTLQWRRFYMAWQALSLIILFNSLILLTGHIYEVPFFYKTGQTHAISIQVALLFFFIAAGILLLRPRQGLMTLLTRNTASGKIARQLIPASFLVPLFLGWLRLEGEIKGIVNNTFGIALFTLASIFILIAVIFWSLKFLRTEEGKRLEVEVSLRHSEEHIESIFRNAPDSIIVFDETEMITQWNPKSQEIFGWSEMEVMGKPISNVFSLGIFIQNIENTIHQFLREDESEYLGKSIELKAKKKDGNIIYAEVTISKTQIKGLKYFIAFVKDITERRKIQKELRDSENFLNTIIENIPDMIFVKDANELRFIRFNKAGEDLLGLPRKELIGKNDFDFFSQEQAEFFTENDKSVLLSGVLKDIPEEPINTMKKGLRFLHTKKIPIYNTLGKAEYLLGISEDITDINNVYAELNQKTEDLLRSNTELEQFAYVASHDLQEPLRMITSYLQLLERKYKEVLDDNAKEYIHFAVDGSVRMKNLINSLLSYSQIGKGKVNFELVDFNAVIKEVQLNLQKNIEDNQAVIHVEILPEILCIRTQMVQLFQNLLTNALKFKSDQKPEISIRFVKIDNGYEFSVKDNGIGIDPNYAEKIFLIFQRLHGVTEYPGTGIGLAICKKIVERHHGKIWIQSDSTPGADFRFTLLT